MKMKERWNYKGLGQVRYGHHETYERPCAWFDEVGGTFEDWGCGCAMAKQYVKKCAYVGLDGSRNDYADRCDVDLTEYTSKADCILLRHVLDHNLEWRKILDNAMSSFRKRMVVIIIHDLGPETKVIFENTLPRFPGVPDLQFCLKDLMDVMGPYVVKIETVPANNESPNNETLFYLERE